MLWLWIPLAVLVGGVVLAALAFHLYVRRNYVPVVKRVFLEKPLFILPFGQPVPGAEEVTLTTPDGLPLQGCYVRTERPRKGVILFGLEFGSNKWGCLAYTDFLIEQGYDVFSFEMRGQGKSPAQPGYEPLQWITYHEVTDFQTALEYLKNRPDRDPRGIGFFGLSKGGGSGLIAAAHNNFVRCFVTDGIFGTMTTMVPFMQKWKFIFISVLWVAKSLPRWYLRRLARITTRQIARERNCHYPDLERAMKYLSPRPLLMIHGSADNYIKPEMARELFGMAREPKEFWLVDKAKHNQALHVAGDEYRRRVLAFFDTHLAALPLPAAPTPSVNGTPAPAPPVTSERTPL